MIHHGKINTRAVLFTEDGKLKLCNNFMINPRPHDKNNEKNQVFFMGLTLLTAATLNTYFNTQGYDDP